MNTSAVATEPRALSVEVSADALVVHLKDGRILRVPIDWFPRLRDASDRERNSFELYADGYAIHWSSLDEDISIPALLGLPD